MNLPDYRGRFAPSPTGPLHFGSLTAAVGSYLDARHHGGTWLVRIEDLDPPREVAGAGDAILRTLEAWGMHWDEPVVYQSRRTGHYEEALRRLQEAGMVYGCACTRREIADSSLPGRRGAVYPGTCRNGVPAGRRARALRVRTDSNEIILHDLLQGDYSQIIERDSGDFVLRRADGLTAYQLAVVVDDAEQNVTSIVRGADLLESTPRQIYLQQLLGYPTPQYLHLPVATGSNGEKLSKQTCALPVSEQYDHHIMRAVLTFLNQPQPGRETVRDRDAMWEHAIRNWQRAVLPAVPACPAPAAHTN